MIEDRGDTDSTPSQDVGDADRRRAGKPAPSSQGLFTSFRANTPWLYLDIDRAQAKTLGVSIAELFDTLQVYLGSLYVNDFNRFGRTWQVNVQGDANFRQQIEDLKQLKVRNDRGAMVPLGTVSQRPRRQRPGDDRPLQHVPAGADQRHAGPGRQLGPGHRAMETGRAANCRQVDADRVDRAGPAAAPDRQHGHVRRSCWPWCWCSWCWPRSTRAGRCRWP